MLLEGDFFEGDFSLIILITRILLKYYITSISHRFMIGISINSILRTVRPNIL